MTEFLIGTGGWAYFYVPGLDPLVAYSKAFNFVEVGSTFYEVPNLKTVESWRKRVPPTFRFAVRCHRSITHGYKLEPTEEAYKTFDKMMAICKTLRAEILHIQTPPTLRFDVPKINAIRNFFLSMNLKGIRVAWEVRQRTKGALPSDLVRLMRDLNMIHCVDLSKEEPAFESDILYTRLFGKGVRNIYQFTDEELKEIDRKAGKGSHRMAILCFHGVKMYKDAARFKVYKQTGSFPMATRSTGLDSLKEVLSEDARFPCTKQQLIQHQGWKLIDLTQTKRIRASMILERLPEKTYHSEGEVIQALRALLKPEGLRGGKQCF